ncbi:hypothetical protein BV25DRAFT_1826347 [Artomyces pyxidatus]|uniref:Uncharacterized protein n=1 Tax=Artomyces pyxidatus TaxID=48021 RepID=A0ACB8SZK8_9AGAM|nr:hypothetical protein BV25DRAFT_1826347 [Artomyces pyxidatus]
MVLKHRPSFLTLHPDHPSRHTAQAHIRVGREQHPCIAAQSCPTGQSNHICCRSLAPFSANSYVWENVCGITGVAPDTPTASFCEPLPSCPEGVIAACCETLDNCQSGVDGPIGINCTEVEN